MLELKNIYAGYTEGKHILNGLDLTINEGEVIGVIGQNGSGKSTLAKVIMNLAPYVSGEIFFNRKPIIKKSTNVIAEMGIGYFLQGGRIFPQLTVKENLQFAMRELKKTEAIDRMDELTNWFNFLRNYRENIQASYLSGGEQHQLALAMVLVSKPKLLILDEPSAGLSPVNTQALYEIINNYRENNNTTILLIEQKIFMAFTNSNRLVLLGDGIILFEGKATKEFEKKITEYFFNTKGLLQ